MKPTSYAFERYEEEHLELEITRSQGSNNEWGVYINSDLGEIWLEPDQLEFVIDALAEIAGEELGIFYTKEDINEPLPF